MKYFQFDQNNSGGSFQEPAYLVIVEAETPEQACQLAEDIAGLYFDGRSKGIDCDCCGDRWSRPWGDGEAIPASYVDKFQLAWKCKNFVLLVKGRQKYVLTNKEAAAQFVEEGRYAFLIEDGKLVMNYLGEED